MAQPSAEEIIRDTVAAMNRNDWEAALQNTSPDLVFDTSRTLGEWRGVHTGRADVKGVWQDFAAPWVALRREIDEVIEGDGCAVAIITVYFEGRDGIEVRIRMNWVWTIQQGVVSRIAVFNDLDQARAAAGLPH